MTAYDAAKNQRGTSSPAMVMTPTGDTQPPSVSGSLQVSATGASTIALSWQASTDDSGVAGYQVYRGTTFIGRTERDEPHR